MGRFAKNPQLARDPESAVVPRGATTLRPAVPTTGAVRFNSTLTALEYWNGASWKQMTAQGLVTLTVEDLYTGTPAQQDFTMSVTNAPGNIPENIMVFVAGVYQNPLTAYTTTGTTLHFTSAPPTTISDRIIVVHGMNSTVVV